MPKSSSFSLLTMLTLSVFLLGSCADPVDPRSARRVILSTGQDAKVLSVNLDQSYVTIQSDHGKRLAYWDPSTEFYRDNQRVKTYLPEVGDKWLFNGVEANQEIYLRRVFIK